ncbi:hypothetical protein P691DRAFT_804246 [Macrolepiota fuliginosa MF-IS2]|uniref:Uncharacterized protein n=1 Tax=Macrolepiota fuliginosa MF-IS2 TaxID=1400762 RepID=A0A9P6C8V5_9AGAR|nr:hypothetical protein P691DRAFT_804246 [Macrolepiota fuliginosa MF-IS2]
MFHEHASADHSQSSPMVNAGRSAGSKPQAFSRAPAPEAQPTLPSLYLSPLPPSERVRCAQSDHLYSSTITYGKNQVIETTAEYGSLAPDVHSPGN